MRHHARRFKILAFALAVAASPAHADATADVRQMVERFRIAVIARDAPALRDLFVDGHDSWFSVSTDAEHARRLAKDPQAKRHQPGSVARFAASLARDPARRLEERFSNVQVRTDGAVATVHFDYVFLADEVPTNHGQEAWQLVRTDAGWKIASLVYSVDTAPDRGLLAALDDGLRPVVLEPGAPPPRWSLAERMAFHRVPGVAVAVVKNGVVVQSAGYGVRAAGAVDPVDADTVFSVGSVSKVVAAATTMRLVAQGRLDLDRDVNGYLSGWKVPRPPAGGARFVTLRMLLSHTAGLGVHGFEDYAPDAPVPTLLQTLAGTAPSLNPPVRFKHPAGVTADYSGGGYEVAQLALESVAGEPLDALARKVVFAPAGMPRSTFASPLPADYGNVAHAHDEAGKPVALPRGWQTFPQAAAAGLWTSANDLGAFVGVLIRSYQGKDAFLPREIAAQMLTGTAVGEHGLGPRLAGDGPSRIFHHGGANDSYRAWIEGYPETGDGFAILTNGANGTALAREIRNALSDALGHGANPPVRTIALADGASPDFAGTYRRDASVPMELRRSLADVVEAEQFDVKIADGAVVVHASGEERPWPLRAVGPSRFVTANGALRFEFARNAHGRVDALVLSADDSRSRELWRRAP